MNAAELVGVRELRQNLSVYLRRVQAGESLRVTERGVPVAILGPLPGVGRRLDRMISEGLVRKASRRPGNLGMPTPPRHVPLMSLSDALKQLRSDER